MNDEPAVLLTLLLAILDVRVAGLEVAEHEGAVLAPAGDHGVGQGRPAELALEVAVGADVHPVVLGRDVGDDGVVEDHQDAGLLRGLKHHETELAALRQQG